MWGPHSVAVATLAGSVTSGLSAVCLLMACCCSMMTVRMRSPLLRALSGWWKAQFECSRSNCEVHGQTINLYQELKEHECRGRDVPEGIWLWVLHEVHPCEYCLSNYVRKDTQINRFMAMISSLWPCLTVSEILFPFKTTWNLGLCRWNNSLSTGHVRVSLRERGGGKIDEKFKLDLLRYYQKNWIPRGFASTVVNWMCITMSWTVSMKWDYCNSRKKDKRSEEKIKTKSFLCSFSFDVISRQRHSSLMRL